MKKRAYNVKRVTVVTLVVLAVAHEILIRWLARHEAGMAIFTPGAMSMEEAVAWLGLFFMTRLFLVFVAPAMIAGWLAAAVYSRVFNTATRSR